MKRTMLILLLLTAATALPACNDGNASVDTDTSAIPPAVDDEDTSVTIKDGVALVLDLPKDRFEPGETFTATITLKNRSGEPLEIEASSSALYKIHLMRPHRTDWQTFKTYPDAAAMVITPWTLPAGEERAFTPELTVAEDWPTHELIRVQAEINGLPEIKTAVDIEVVNQD
jgi:hypothetical protein